MAMQIVRRGSMLNPETRVLAQNLGCLILNHRPGFTFFFYFYSDVKSTMLQSFSFIEADLAMEIQIKHGDS